MPSEVAAHSLEQYRSDAPMRLLKQPEQMFEVTPRLRTRRQYRPQKESSW